MALRLTLIGALVFACGLPAVITAGPKEKRAEPASKEAPLVRVVYPVADLVVPPPGLGEGNAAPPAQRAPGQTQEDLLITLLKAKIAPGSWQTSR